MRSRAEVVADRAPQMIGGLARILCRTPRTTLCAVTHCAAHRYSSVAVALPHEPAPPRDPAVPATPTWSLADYRLSAAGIPPLTDADVVRTAVLAHLAIAAPGTPAFAALKADLSATLAAAAEVTRHVRQEPGGALTPDYADETDESTADEGGTDAEAEARLAGLRPDVVVEGGDTEAVLRHAARREGAFFVVPTAAP